ncbi:hypothetical protein CC86DRAFT_55023 [Ophiobolus disseminans]|uniref:Uncharacterized protein n=1 Tax=Ophiobolus disseminans TaxID=1469910 RepID=A0A6A6ZVP5_9PLEO|nr:hypothetical protein CC86DRAFT_55023 [Ophiobolus disseminans]
MPRPNPLPSLSFLSLILNAHSTRWPSSSRNAIFLLILCLILCVAQFAVILTLGIKLLHMPKTVMCYQPVADLGWVQRDVKYPVTVLGLEMGMGMQGEGERFGVGRNSGVVGIAYAAIITPVVINTLLIILGWLHFRKAGISNRTGVFCGFTALCLLIIGTLQDAWLGPDLHSTRKATPCYLEYDTFAAAKHERNVRLALGVCSEIFSGLGALCMALYLALAISACRQNRKDAAQSQTRMHILETPRAPANTPDNSLHSLQLHPHPHPQPHPAASISCAHLPSHTDAVPTITAAEPASNPASETASTQGQYTRSEDEEASLGREVDGWTPLNADEVREAARAGGEEAVKKDEDVDEESDRRKDSRNH